MKDPEKIIKRIQDYVDIWEPMLDLPGVDVEHVFLPRVAEEDHTMVADTSASWEYRCATIRWYLGRVATLDDNDLENSVVHEYVHVLLAVMEKHLPERYRNSENSEHAVENITRALTAVYRTGMSS